MGNPVVVTTSHRGVFFGYFKSKVGGTVVLKDARNCLYWSRDVKGFLGLAATGPSKECRVGPKVDIELADVTCIAQCTEDAVKAWESEPWS